MEKYKQTEHILHQNWMCGKPEKTLALNKYQSALWDVRIIKDD